MSEIQNHTDELKIVGKRYYGRWLSALVVLLCLAAMAHSMINNPRFEWG
ncbi:amino acid ABC transporter permease, partial [Pantoea agglomerans]